MWETTVQPWFVPCRNVTGFAVPLIATYSETDSVQFNDVYVRKLGFQSNLCETFAEEKKAPLWRLSLGWGVSQKTVFNRYWTGFQSKRWRSFLQYLPSCILTYSSKRRVLTQKKGWNIHLSLLLVMSRRWWPTNPKYVFPWLLQVMRVLKALVRKSSYLLDFNQTHNSAMFCETFALQIHHS